MIISEIIVQVFDGVVVLKIFVLCGEKIEKQIEYIIEPGDYRITVD
jgi:hypothetical protein